MNRRRLTALYDHLLGNRDQVDIDHWYLEHGTFRNDPTAHTARRLLSPDAFADCTTTGCFAGWVVHLWPDEAAAILSRDAVHNRHPEFQAVPHIAAEILDLDADEANALFYATDTDTGFAVLDNMVEYGSIVMS